MILQEIVRDKFSSAQGWSGQVWPDGAVARCPLIRQQAIQNSAKESGRGIHVCIGTKASAEEVVEDCFRSKKHKPESQVLKLHKQAIMSLTGLKQKGWRTLLFEGVLCLATEHETLVYLMPKSSTKRADGTTSLSLTFSIDRVISKESLEPTGGSPRSLLRMYSIASRGRSDKFPTSGALYLPVSPIRSPQELGPP